MNRRISSNLIYTLENKSPLKNGIIELDESGVVLKIIENPSNTELAHTEFYNGVIVPGFVNAHHHIELSHLKNKITKRTGLTGFIDELMAIRNNFSSEEKHKAQKLSFKEMYRKGIVAIGDISNGLDSFEMKFLNRQLFDFHNFIEVLGFENQSAKLVMDKAIDLQKVFSEISSSSIVPHAMYSVSHDLLKMVSEWAALNNGIISVHNQETSSEDSVLQAKNGKLGDFLAKRGNSLTDLVQGSSSLSSLYSIIKQQQLLLIHNTFSLPEEIESYQNENNYIVFCPNSNLFIENTLPKIDLIAKTCDNICLGTDSLASNDDISVFSEMKTILTNFSELKFPDVLQWATINGAKALKLHNKLGSITVGKSPGLNLIQGFNFKSQTISSKSKVSRLV